MKKFALLAAAALLASPVAFAADKDLCEINMQEIEDNMATSMTTLGQPAKGQVEDHVNQARQAQQAGDTKGCITHSTKALDELKGPGSSGSTGSSGTGSGSSN
ncbi:hypothetical protein [Stutzerimonas stutzeri]|uniref:hypothetical protein n=1 Tax=Stutzerimonas stutzeri TaxID=316 RepID=UPI0021094837|nr:hypothetical protein [Stutzerimonas stutzeri]MCQ4322835.1 hypothetical protein [Stutzerimonas stutzeri]